MNILTDRKKHHKINDKLLPGSQPEDSGKDNDTLSNMMGVESNRNIHELLNSLKPEFKEILILKYFNDMDYKEIGTLLGIHRGTVMSRLYNARKAFHKIYIKYSKEV